jgi:pimeloyl-ACP methyl ester carboxylesterase
MCPIDILSVTLSNGSVLLELASLTPSQRLLRDPRVGPLFAKLASRPVFRAQIRRVLGSPNAISDEEIDLMWASIVHRDGRAALPRISSYLDERVRFRSRWVGALASLDIPAHLLWGRLDSVAVPKIAEALAETIPGASLTWLEGLGHYPMLEGPERWSKAAVDFLDALGKNP